MIDYQLLPQPRQNGGSLLDFQDPTAAVGEPLPNDTLVVITYSLSYNTAYHNILALTTAGDLCLMQNQTLIPVAQRRTDSRTRAHASARARAAQHGTARQR